MARSKTIAEMEMDPIVYCTTALIDELKSRHKRMRDDLWVQRVQGMFYNFIATYHTEAALNSVVKRLPEELKRVA